MKISKHKYIIISNKNVEKESNIFFTNFRIICCSGNVLYSVPFYYIKKHELVKPKFKGRNNIKLEIEENINLSYSCPLYIKENYRPEDINKTNLILPKKVYLKFNDNKADIQKSYETYHPFQ